MTRGTHLRTSARATTVPHCARRTPDARSCCSCSSRCKQYARQTHAAAAVVAADANRRDSRHTLVTEGTHLRTPARATAVPHCARRTQLLQLWQQMQAMCVMCVVTCAGVQFQGNGPDTLCFAEEGLPHLRPRRCHDCALQELLSSGLLA